MRRVQIAASARLALQTILEQGAEKFGGGDEAREALG